MSSPKDTVALWRHHMQDEADAAFLYRQLAATEQQNDRREIYARLAEVEDRHVGMWRKILAESGVDEAPAAPSFRVRLLAQIARWFGPSLLLALLLREEGQEVKGYLELHRNSAPGIAKDTALTLAKESAEHAGTLGKLTLSDGEPWHKIESGGFLRNVIYGFNDGLTANLGLLAGVIGASVESQIILVTGIAGTIADALSMGASGYLAAKSEQEVYAYEIAMEREEIRLMPDLEEEELALIYEAKGVERQRAKEMSHDVMQNAELALEEMVREELKIGPARTTPFKEGWITGIATAIGAIIPVVPFFFMEGITAIWVSFAVAMISHFGVGAFRSVFTGRGMLRSGTDMFVVGLGVAAVGYVVGDLILKML